MGMNTETNKKIDVCVCGRSPLPDSDILEVIRADLPKLVETKIKSSLHKKANRLSAYVEMLVVNESKVEFGYMDASYPFKGRPQDGHICLEDVSRRLQPRTAGISVRYHPPLN
jgi:hypothetical protein